MPELSSFLGIVIGMFYNEHGVPHFHAVYGEHEISVEVGTASHLWSDLMDCHVMEARHVGGHVVWLRVRDGTTGEIDLTPLLHGPVFKPLRDPEYFRAFTIYPDFHTLVWPNGADVAPEFLREKVRVSA